MKKIFAFQKDKNNLKLLLFYVKDNAVFIEDYQQREIGAEGNPARPELAGGTSVLIKQFLSYNKAKVFRTVCFLPLSSIYLRKLAFPYRSISKIKKSIRFAIEPHIPISVESAKVFFQPIYAKNSKQSRFFAAGGIEVISFVVPEVLLNEQLELINSCGLVCNEIYLEPLSIFNFLISRIKIKQNVLWLYVGNDTTYVFSALKDGMLSDLRQIPMGRSEIIEEKDELTREISTVLLSQTSQLSENKISEIYVSGLPTAERQAGNLEICDWLAENFNIPAKAIELDELLSVSQSVDSSKQAEEEHSNEDTLALKPLASEFIPEILYAGFATNGAVLNFYPPVLQEKEKRSIRISFFLAIFILIAITFRLQFERNIYERKFDVPNTRIEEIFTQTFPDAVDKRTPLIQMRAIVKNLKDSSLPTDLISLSPLEALREISQNLDRNLQIELDSFRAKENDITISGSASSYGDIDKIKSALEHSPLFSKVDIESAQTTAQAVSFRLKISPALNK
ncbi:MAG: PilN domain-containing protein [Candidatus Omnitrophica bacterium]|nr:PilN domain-containing protein [Candidatus Omnitrophota bacterium]